MVDLCPSDRALRKEPEAAVRDRGISTGAVLSECGTYRYRLWRRWGDGTALLFVMLNPSTADATADDATIRRCIRFAQAHGHGAVEVVNLYAYRATDPKDLRRAGYPVGPDNDEHTVAAAREAAEVCVAWGANVRDLERPQIVLPMLRKLGVSLQCLRITRSGFPQHPLMLPSSYRLQPFTHEAISRAMAGETEPSSAASGCSHTARPDDQSKVDDQEPTAWSST